MTRSRVKKKIFFYFYPWTQAPWEIRGKVIPLCFFSFFLFFYFKNAWGAFFVMPNSSWAAKWDSVIDGSKIILIVCWWMSGGYSQRTTPEIRPRIPAIVRATCPPQAKVLCRRKDRVSIHRIHTCRFVSLEPRCATYRRCQGRPVRLREACAPLQICCLIDCLPATWRQHATRKPPCTAADRPQ